MVTNAGDDVSGATPNQLRWAMNQVNAGTGGDTINFAIGASGSHQTITLDAALPAITKSVNIAGWSQNGGLPGVWIEIIGAGLSADGLTFNTGNCQIAGLAVDNFTGNGIVLNNLAGTGDTIQSCNIGTDTTGIAIGKGNTGNGIRINGPNNLIGPGNTIVGGELRPFRMNERVKYQSNKGLMTALLTDFKLSTVFHLPGEVSDSKLFKKDGGNKVSREVNGNDLLKKYNSFYAEDNAALKKKVKTANSLDFEKLFADTTEVLREGANVRVNKVGEPLFDFDKEVKEAKAAYPALRNKLNLPDNVKLPGE